MWFGKRRKMSNNGGRRADPLQTACCLECSYDRRQTATASILALEPSKRLSGLLLLPLAVSSIILIFR
ncbi:hypothetical protein BDV35DRAFT_356699 [Aspergillus flavus]|uniref:Uncharacterized protein n=1 Tax=Aspergillus flavus TaxID=5059 RepID=A0A5N6GYH4_ASPFL|nr:hypothetical protein BDV35DRAFT_356699 [Aspergillus flavus]